MDSVEQMGVDNEVNQLAVLEEMFKREHEQVLFCSDKDLGLKAIIAIHNTTLGPSLGGLRMWNYHSESDALKDVLRLSRGMTYKASVAGLDLGGGKAVIIGDARTQKNEKLLRRFGQFVDSLSGRYITAEDVGMSSGDMVHISKETEHVTGMPQDLGGSGDPSPVTAFGVFCGIKASAKEVWGNDSLEGKKVIVQGIGSVGENVVAHLTKSGAKVWINDIHEDRVKEVAAKYGAEFIEAEKIYSADVDIYAPCALGATLNAETIPQLKCSIVAGAANNQLAQEVEHGKLITERGILYAPDFVINAGGLISVYAELKSDSNEQTMDRAGKIYDTLLSIFSAAKEDNIPTYLAANKIAEKRLADNKPSL